MQNCNYKKWRKTINNSFKKWLNIFKNSESLSDLKENMKKNMKTWKVTWKKIKAGTSILKQYLDKTCVKKKFQGLQYITFLVENAM